MEEKARYPLYIRNFIFGVEDSLVSTVGLLSGIATAEAAKSAILLTGLIYIFVEAFSMAVGSFLSEESAEEYETKAEVKARLPIFGAAIMFISFVIAGFVPILPYLIFREPAALFGSIIFSLAVLFILGIINGKISKVKPWPHALRMVVLGGLAIVIGVLVGKFFKTV